MLKIEPIERDQYSFMRWKVNDQYYVELWHTIFKSVRVCCRKIDNPHFYIYDLSHNNENLIYEEIINENWEIPSLGTKIWTWDQKDFEGNQVPDGSYVIIGGFIIDGREHPVYGGFEIVKKLDKNIFLLKNFLISHIYNKYFKPLSIL